MKMPEPSQEAVERMAEKFHAVYHKEALRQNNVRHPGAYKDLPENVKEFDRVLARFVLGLLISAAEALRESERLLKNEHYPKDIGQRKKNLDALAALKEAGVA